MNISEYGKELSNIGKKLSDMSNYYEIENNMVKKLKNNKFICEDTLHRLKNMKSPSFISLEHLMLENSFDQLITAYSIQLNSINDEFQITNMELFENGTKIEDKEMEKLGSILLTILTKCSSFAFNNNQQV